MTNMELLLNALAEQTAAEDSTFRRREVVLKSNILPAMSIATAQERRENSIKVDTSPPTFGGDPNNRLQRSGKTKSHPHTAVRLRMGYCFWGCRPR